MYPHTSLNTVLLQNGFREGLPKEGARTQILPTPETSENKTPLPQGVAWASCNSLSPCSVVWFLLLLLLLLLPPPPPRLLLLLLLLLLILAGNKKCSIPVSAVHTLLLQNGFRGGLPRKWGRTQITPTPETPETKNPPASGIRFGFM